MRVLQLLNLAGVLALAVLCAAQWQNNRQFNLEVNRLEAIRIDQSRKLDERGNTIAGQARDLDDLRQHLTRLTAEVKETEGKLALSQRDAAQCAAERDQLKESVRKWSEAVTARDERLRENQQQIRDLAANMSETTVKFNELATNYNAIVVQLNERTMQYNKLIERFNQIAQQQRN